MNKKKVTALLSVAKESLFLTGLAENGQIDGALRGDISTFGANVVMTSLPAAVAFFINQGNAAALRHKLIQAVFYCVTGQMTPEDKIQEIMDYVRRHNNADLKDKVMNAAIAIKLAMHYFELV